jgi:hypothetical protein
MNIETLLSEREDLPLYNGVKIYSIVYIKYRIKYDIYRYNR